MLETVSGRLGEAAFAPEAGCSQGQPRGNHSNGHDLIGGGLSYHPAGVGWFILILPFCPGCQSPTGRDLVHPAAAMGTPSCPSTGKTSSTGMHPSPPPPALDHRAAARGSISVHGSW